MEKMINWSGDLQTDAVTILQNSGGMVVSPTKVGYIVLTSDLIGLRRKFDAKQRKLSKPAVVLCGSIEQLTELAQVNDAILNFYVESYEKDILLGCILPWKEEALKYIPDDESNKLVRDSRGTSCFVVKFGKPSEQIVSKLWDERKQLCFASSANPSGKGNRGIVEGIGERIMNEADLIIEANDYVASIQPFKSEAQRYEQGVMVSMVDEQGKLIPNQNTIVNLKPCPIVIRKGLGIDKIMMLLINNFNTWEYAHGLYY